MDDVGQVVARWRTARGISTKKLAADVANQFGATVSRQNIENLEAGRVKQPKYMYALARVMGYTDVQALLSGDDPPSGDSAPITQPQGEVSMPKNWPFRAIPPDYIDDLQPHEVSVMQSHMLDAVRKIASDRDAEAMVAKARTGKRSSA